MLGWLAVNAFVWAVRVAVLVGACFSMRYILATELGYRVDVPQLLLGGLLIIVTVKLWMPWTSPLAKETRSFDDVSGL